MSCELIGLVLRLLAETAKFSFSFDVAACINAVVLLLAIHRFVTSRKAKEPEKVTEIEIAGIKFREGEDF